MDKSLYELPSDCAVRGGMLTDTVYVTFKNDPSLRTQTKILALKFDEREGVRTGDHHHARALIAVTDRLFKPDWWSVNDRGSDDYFANSVEDFYLGAYSETKYKMFLDELKKDGVTFDGSNKQMLRKVCPAVEEHLGHDECRQAGGRMGEGRERSGNHAAGGRINDNGK